MALDTPVQGDGTDDMQVHRRDYSGFLRLFKWGAVALLIIALAVMVIISD